MPHIFVQVTTFDILKLWLRVQAILPLKGRMQSCTRLRLTTYNLRVILVAEEYYRESPMDAYCLLPKIASA